MPKEIVVTLINAAAAIATTLVLVLMTHVRG